MLGRRGPAPEKEEAVIGKLARILGAGVVITGLVGLALERAGLRSCGCYPECWCKRPGLNLFRWITPPTLHRGPWRESEASGEADL